MNIVPRASAHFPRISQVFSPEWIKSAHLGFMIIPFILLSFLST